MARKKWAAIRDKYITPERQAQNKEHAEHTLQSLRDLRKARTLTQEQLSESLKMTQGDISKLERRTDLYLSTLRRYIEAMGGELQIVARFPDGDEIPVVIAEVAEEPEHELARA